MKRIAWLRRIVAVTDATRLYVDFLLANLRFFFACEPVN